MTAEPAWDVVIRGGGVAGGAAALLLARRGYRALVLEEHRLPQDRVCGEFLSPEAIPILRRLGVAEAVTAAGASPIETAVICGAAGRRVRIPLPAAGLGLSRRRLDGLLLQAAEEAGAVVRRGALAVRWMADPGKGWTALGARGEDLGRGRIAVDAAGKRADAWGEGAGPRRPPPRRAGWVGIKAHFRGAAGGFGTVALHSFPGGYCGTAPVEDGLMNACLVAAENRLRRAGGPDALFGAVLAACPSLAAQLAGAERVQPAFVCTAGLHYDANPRRAPVPRIGDAAGLITPLTGDGMAMALRGAELAVSHLEACLRGERPAAELEGAVRAALQSEFIGRRGWGRALHELLTRPRAVAVVACVLSRTPAAGQYLFARTRGAVPDAAGAR